MAGLRGPDRRDCAKLYPVAAEPSCGRGAGDVKAATDGSNLLSAASDEGCPKDFSKGLGSREKWLVSFATEEK